MYLDISDNSCKQCDISCLLCTGPSFNECSSCDTGYTLINNTCSIDCSIGFYEDF